MKDVNIQTTHKVQQQDTKDTKTNVVQYAAHYTIYIYIIKNINISK